MTEPGLQPNSDNSKYLTGLQCIEPGCEEPAGTAWSPYWCRIHNAERLERISKQLEGLLNDSTDINS